jgi:hypothetical protein
MTAKRIRIVALSLVGAFLVYLLVGFLAVPALVKHQLVDFVESKLKHKLTLGEVRFNPLTFAAELNDFDLREASGGALLSFKRLFINFQASSVIHRAWTFAEVSLESPAINGEIRPDGSLNFSALLDALRDPNAKPDTPLPRFQIDSVKLADGRLDLADRQAGDAARLRLAPITFELTDLSTVDADKSPYKLTARTVDGESMQWTGNVTLTPIASSGKLALTGWKVATLTRLLGERVATDKATGQFDLSLNYRAGYADGKPSLTIGSLGMSLTDLSLTAKGAASPLAAADAFGVIGAEFDLQERTGSIERIELAKPRIDLQMSADGQANWSAVLPRAPAHVASNPGATPDAVSADSTPASATPTAQPSTSPWRVKLAQLAIMDLGLKYSDRRPDSHADLALERATLSMAAIAEHNADGTSIAVESPKLSIGESTMMQGAQKTSIKNIELSATGVNTRLSANGTDMRVDALRGTLAGVGLRDDSLHIQGVKLSGDSLNLGLGSEPGAAARITLNELNAEVTGVDGRLARGRKNALDLGTLAATAKSVNVALTEDDPELRADGLSVVLGAFKLHDPIDGKELARAARVEASGGMLNLRDRQIVWERLLVADGLSTATTSADGTTSWGPLLTALGAPADGQAPKRGKPKGEPAKPWQVSLKTIEIRSFGALIADQRPQPPIELAIVDINARVQNASTDASKSAQIEARARTKDGGQLAAAGQVNLQTLASDLKIKVTDLSLRPAQALLAQHARLQINSALASAQGRLRYGQPKSAGANLLFEGTLGLAKLAIEETLPTQPFLTLDALSASEVKLSRAPNRLEIADLRLSGLATKLLIAEDQSVNFTQVLRAPPAGSQPAPPTAAPTAKPSALAQDDDFPISISRIRIENSRLEFADLSLRPQFATQMHELQGVVTGISTSRNSRAQLELEARVDEFGSAKIRGDINVFEPRRYTDVGMTFRNIEMTALTPYSGKFAGYRIASGKLSVDLQYKIKDSALVGENKIVLDKLELGERVESPSAWDIPLELAIAILRDSDGRIDIGLPVSGSLDDPQFSYGHLIWKAIGNLLTRIVTAPFRALASLFGGGSEKLDSIDFDAGGDRLLPPERQKLKMVAEALQKRPQLKLTVKPAYSAKSDRPALQTLAMRSAVATRAGIKLEPGESPGPVDFANARTQQAIQSLFEEKFSAAAARDLRASLQNEAAVKSAEGAKADKKPTPPPADTIYRTMAQRLVEAFPVSDADLSALAQRRGEAIATELRDAGKVDAARLSTSSSQASDTDSAKVVGCALELGVAK